MDRTGIGIICLCLWVAALVANVQTNVNVALDKTYSQSSKSSPWLVDSNQAANGDTDGGYSTNCIETNDTGDLYPWWQVNLGRKYPVKDITVWARTNQQRLLYPFTITVDGQTCTSQTTYSSRNNELTCPAVMYGQTVRLTRQGNDQEDTADRILSVCEIQVWVPSGVSQCPVGKYGTSCDMDCNNKCGKGSGKNACYQSSGYCYDGCVNGWYGDQCSIPCPTGCEIHVCQRSGQCSPCKTGYKGNTCSECESKYYKTNAGTCNICSTNCPSRSCDGPAGKCNGCVDGRYGDLCTSRCSTNCKRCDQDTGVCTECARDNFMLSACTECKDGYFIIHNTQCARCSINCQSRSCDKRTGTCNGCVAGYYGNQCATPCPTGCLNNVCQQSGQCSPCKTGYTGSTCSGCQDGYYKTNTDRCLRCSSNCQSRSCNKQTGRCNGCIDDRYGTMCAMSCPTAKCQRCHQDTGVCTQCTPNTYLMPPDCRECQDRYYKSNTGTCIRCSDNCQSQSCDRQTGTCHGCVDGRHGDLCASRCSSNCKRCDQDTGVCTQCALDNFMLPACTGCVDGYYGNQCATPCSTGCVNNVCQQSAGLCSPCKTGYTGNSCSECQDGYYKTDTDTCIMCSHICRSQSCDSPTGRCQECVEGRYGDLCNKMCPTVNCLQCDQHTGQCEQCAQGSNLQLPHCAESSGEAINTSVLIGSVVGAGLFIGLCVIVLGVVIWVLKSRKTSHENRNAKNVPDASTSTSHTPPRTTTRAERGQSAAVMQEATAEGGDHYEILGDLPLSTISVTSDPSTLPDIKVHVTDTYVNNPYDRPAVLYRNTGDVHLYE